MVRLLQRGRPLLILLGGAMLFLGAWLQLRPPSAPAPGDPAVETLAQLRKILPAILVVLLLVSAVAIRLMALVHEHLLPEGECEAAPWGLRMFVFFSLLQLSASVMVFSGYRGLSSVTQLPPLERNNILQMLGLQSVVSLVLVLSILAMVRRGGPTARHALGLRWASPIRTVSAVSQLLVLYVPAYLLSLLLGVLVYLLLNKQPGTQGVVQQAMSLRGTPTFYLFACFAVLVAPVTEELLYRGILYPALRKRLPVAWAAGICGLAFALVHLEPSALIPLFGLGTLLALLFERTGSLLAPICAHAMFNATQLAYMLAAG